MTQPSQIGAPVTHPAPLRHRVPGWIVTAGLVVAPAAWFLQLNASYLLGTTHCPGVLAGPSLATAHSAIIAAGIVSAVLALLAMASAVRAWSPTRTEGPGDHHDALTTGHGRTRFLALAGFIVSCIFLVAVVFSLFVPLLVRSCGA